MDRSGRRLALSDLFVAALERPLGPSWVLFGPSWRLWSPPPKAFLEAPEGSDRPTVCSGHLERLRDPAQKAPGPKTSYFTMFLGPEQPSTTHFDNPRWVYFRGPGPPCKI